MPTPFKSVEEKKLLGTYRKDRDKKKEVDLKNSIKITNIECPKDIESKESWDRIVPSLCGLGIVYQQDVDMLHNAFILLDRIAYTQKRIKEVQKDIIKSPLDENNITKYNTYSTMQRRDMSLYTEIMKCFLVSPRERLRAAIEMNTIIDKPVTALNRFLHKEENEK